MLPALLEFVRDKEKAVWGTCAGMILLADEDGVGGGKVIPGRERQRGWGGIEGLRVWRNLYGSEFAFLREDACLIVRTEKNVGGVNGAGTGYGGGRLAGLVSK